MRRRLKMKPGEKKEEAKVKSFGQYYYEAGNPPVFNSNQYSIEHHPISVVMDGKYKGFSEDKKEAGLAMTCVYYEGYQQHVDGQNCNIKTGDLVYEKGPDDGQCTALLAASDPSGSKPTGDETMILVCVKSK